MDTHTSLHLYKQNFKFSAAHFLIFDAQRAEKLHGHNYQVQVDFTFSPQANKSELGYLVDFNTLKKGIKEILDQWDEHVLLPQKHPDMNFKEEGASLHVRFRDRYYVFPKNEVILLDTYNTSVEELSRLLAEKFLKEFKSHLLVKLTVKVEETRGQAASTSLGT